MIPNKQIGWSQEENLLWEISKQLDSMNSIMCTGPCPSTTTTTTTICNCREIIEAASFGFNFYTCLGDYIECFNPGGCRSPVGECIDISQPYNGVTPSETVTETCKCSPLVNTTNTFVQCGAVNDCPSGACSQPYDYYNVWMIQECIDAWPSIGCQVWLDEAKTTPFPEGSYNNGDSGCIVIIGGVVTTIP